MANRTIGLTKEVVAARKKNDADKVKTTKEKPADK